MSERPDGPVPRISAAQLRRHKWYSRAYAFAAFCLLALAILEVTGNASAFLRTVLMIGIGAAGTGAWILQSKRVCPKCGAVYGLRIRIVNVNTCTSCGADLPQWRPGLEDETGRSDSDR